MYKPQILIIGHGRHGKDTVAELLEFYAGFTFTSSSRKAADVILPALNEAVSAPLRFINPEYVKYATADAAFEDRHNYRMLWKELISLYTASDKASLAKLVLESSDVYVGMRCNEEYEASFALFDHVIWVEAGKRYPPDPSMSIPLGQFNMIYIENNGSLTDLDERVMELCGDMGWDKLYEE